MTLTLKISPGILSMHL